MTDLQKTVGRNILKDACGRLIFCPECDEALSAPAAILITRMKPPVGAGICCVSCFEKNWEPEHTVAFNKLPYAMQVSYKLARWVILRELCNYESVI